MISRKKMRYLEFCYEKSTEIIFFGSYQGHKYSSLSEKTREIFTLVVHNQSTMKTRCRVRVWSIKVGKLE